MLNSDLLKNRLSQYGVAWLTTFGLGLLITLFAPRFVDMRLTEAADLYLPIAFGVIGLALVASLILGLLSSETFLVKLTLLGLTLLLALPLFWAPVLGAVLSAYITHASIEYSEAYASFRILIGQLLMTLFSGALLETVWQAFQVISTIVGFLVGLHQLMGISRHLFGPRSQEA